MNAPRPDVCLADSRTGILLVGHGTRSSPGTQQFLSLAEHLARELAPVLVEPAFLELRQPDIAASVSRLVARGIDRLITVPLLLFAAGHAKEDVPAAVAAALKRANATSVDHRQTAHLGCHPALLELSRLRFAEALQESDATVEMPPRQLCILVGRGSSDSSAIAEMHEFARLRAALASGVEHQVAFVTVALPSLENVLAAAASKNYGRITLQPHLLFEGEVFEAIGEQVRRTAAAGKTGGTQWIMTRVLVDRTSSVTVARQKIQEVVVDRCHEAGIHVVARGRDA